MNTTVVDIKGQKYTLDIDLAIEQKVLIPQISLKPGNVYRKNGSMPILLVNTAWVGCVPANAAYRWNFLGLDGLATFSNEKYNKGRFWSDEEVVSFLIEERMIYIGNINTVVYKALLDMDKNT